MTRPATLLETYADALAAAGGDAQPVRDAAALLAAFGVTSARGVAGRLARLNHHAPWSDPPSASKEGPGPGIADALAPLSALLAAHRGAPDWLIAYIDILARSGPIFTMDALADCFRQTKRPSPSVHRAGEQSMADIKAKAAALAAQLRRVRWADETAQKLWTEAVGPSAPPDLIKELARELRGERHGSLKAARQALQMWRNQRQTHQHGLANVADGASKL